MKRRFFLVALTQLAAVACTKVYNKTDNSTPSDSTSPTPVPQSHEFEFRVNGSISGPVNVTVTDSLNGTTFLSTSLPWFSSFKANRTELFLSLKAEAFTVGPMTAQIFVDGQLFREATSDGSDPTISISGQWNT